MTTLQRNDIDYLRGLVRMDIRKKERGLERFAPKPDQPVEEADEVRQMFEANIEFRHQVLARLVAEKEEIRKEMESEPRVPTKGEQ